AGGCACSEDAMGEPANSPNINVRMIRGVRRNTFSISVIVSNLQGDRRRANETCNSPIRATAGACCRVLLSTRHVPYVNATPGQQKSPRCKSWALRGIAQLYGCGRRASSGKPGVSPTFGQKS